MSLTANHPIQLPAIVWQNSHLSASAKLLYGEIAYLCREEGYCPLSYTYFAERHYVTYKTVKAWLAQLEEVGLIRMRYHASGQQRLLYLESNKEDSIKNQLTVPFT
ncbi:helix-turn-helix domain-containing protein [Tunicatimonas pelagia]|uniref:helix-turn-helix domain-containing protein n=1 Tax=Tunicatimonas pelagia TaxID=931531 RepID=UPI002665898F|nr:helix-turn-helix domain-containing protein [Tunicatimonas pelagia]WKN44289.1 helix-turn-helix domain-containing protein [Tunicatimonas pelagia]